MPSGERCLGRVSWGSVVPWGTAPHGPTCCFRWLLLSHEQNPLILSNLWQFVLSGERCWGRVSWGSVVPWGTAPHGPTCCFRWLLLSRYPLLLLLLAQGLCHSLACRCCPPNLCAAHENEPRASANPTSCGQTNGPWSSLDCKIVLVY